MTEEKSKLPFNIPLPDPNAMKAMEKMMQKVSLLVSLLPPMEVKEIERKFVNTKTKEEFSKTYIAIYIEKPQKAQQ